MESNAAPTERLPLQYLLPSGITMDPDGVGALSWPAGLGPFGQMRDMALNDNLSTVICRPALLSLEECDALVAEGRARQRLEGRVELGADTYRVSHIAWIEPDERNHWIFHKIGTMFREANQHYGFDLVGMFDALQYTEYGAGEHFDWHMDIGMGQSSLRKLSLTIQLAGSEEYEGGDFELVGLGANPEGRRRGSAIFFPSYMGHRVTPVTRGVRCSLVAWASGAPFR